jgi:tetratricopeptide (TPR) repeat protein
MKLRALALSLLLLAAACGPKLPPSPPAAAVPRYPDLILPSVPRGFGTPAAIERHFAGWNWLQNGDLRAAERNFNAALRQSDSFYPAEVGLGYVALVQKKHKEALQHFDRAVVLNPRYAPALGGRAEALLAQGEEAEALQSLDAALQADPSLVALRTRLDVLRFRGQQQGIDNARRLAEANRLDEARTAYNAALAESPQSPFLHRELADVERRAGRPDAALEHASKALELEPDEPRSHVVLGEIHEARGELARAVDEFEAALALQPDESLRARVETLRSRAAFNAMPPEYREIETATAVTRGQMAALFAVRLESLLASARTVSAIVITDTRGHWASPYILAAARANIIEVYPNHTFQPDTVVRRGDLARMVSRVLDLVARRNPQLAAAWRTPARTFRDLPQGNIHYAAAALAVEAGVIAPADDGSFQASRPVTGAEAIAAVTRLAALADQPAR